MPARRSPRWTANDLAVLRAVYPGEGVEGVHTRLPRRSTHAIHVKAHKLGLRCEMVTAAPTHRLTGEALEEAIRLREEEDWSFERIGARFGVSEAGACNAVLVALCPRKGFRPAERDEFGRLLPAGIERLRYALRKGLKGIDIQLRLGLSAGRVAEERRRYNRELKAAGKVLLPAPGGGQAYSGVKLTREAKRAVEALLMEGLGASKITARTGVSNTSVGRIRNRLVRRLRRKGETLPGCDAKGVRHAQAESSRFIPEEVRQALRDQILDGVPVSRAAKILAIGLSSAYRIRDELAAELAARGDQLPSPARPGRICAGAFTESHWPPVGAKEIYAFRELLRTRPFDEAKVEWRRARRAEHDADRARPKTFEEQLARVAAGEIAPVAAIQRRHLETTIIRPEQQARAA